MKKIVIALLVLVTIGSVTGCVWRDGRGWDHGGYGHEGHR